MCIAVAWFLLMLSNILCFAPLSMKTALQWCGLDIWTHKLSGDKVLSGSGNNWTYMDGALLGGLRHSKLPWTRLTTWHHKALGVSIYTVAWQVQTSCKLFVLHTHTTFMPPRNVSFALFFSPWQCHFVWHDKCQYYTPLNALTSAIASSFVHSPAFNFLTTLSTISSAFSFTEVVSWTTCFLVAFSWTA